MKKMQKVLALLLALVLVLGLTTACKKDEKKDPTPAPGTEAPVDGTDAPTNNDPTAAPTDPVTLKVVTMMGGTDPNVEHYKKIVSDFETQYSYVTIEDDSAKADDVWKTKISADFATGNEPDVIQFYTDANAKDVLATDKFVSIEEIRTEYPEYAGDILPAALAAAANADGVQRAIPTAGYWEGLFCNEALFEQAGAEIPTDWASLKTAIEKLNAAGITPIAVSLNEVPHYWIEHLMLMMAGPEEFATLPETAPESWVKGLSLFKDLRDMGAFPKATDTISTDDADNLFSEGKAAMQLEGSWRLNGLSGTAAEATTTVHFCPTLEGGAAEYGTIISGLSSGFYITRKAWEDPAKRDAVVKFVMANTTKEAITNYWGGAGKAAVEVTMPEGMSALHASGFELANNAVAMATPTDARAGGEAYGVLLSSAVGISTGAVKAEDAINEALEIANR